MKFVFAALLCLVTLTGCVNDPGNPGNGNDNNSPYFSYKINSNNEVRVNCEEIRFESSTGGNHIATVLATSQSTRSTFFYSFYGSAAKLDTLKPGVFGIADYVDAQNYSQPGMTFSLKAPQTLGGNDYFVAINPSVGNHTITKIEKGEVVNNKRVFLVSGSYSLRAKKINSDEEATITGKYLFKLLAVVE
jgi:hypothetical protein